MDSAFNMDRIEPTILDAVVHTAAPQSVPAVVWKPNRNELELRQADIVVQEALRLAQDAARSAVSTVSRRAARCPDPVVRHHLVDTSEQIALIAKRLSWRLSNVEDKPSLKHAIEAVWGELNSDYPERISSLEGQCCSAMPLAYAWKALLVQMIVREVAWDAICNSGVDAPVRGEMWTDESKLYLELKVGVAVAQSQILQRVERPVFLASLLDCLHASIRPSAVGSVLVVPLWALTQGRWELALPHRTQGWLG